MTFNHDKAIAATNSDRTTKTFSGNHRSSNSKITPQQLLEEVKTLPESWALVAVGDKKAPLGRDWTTIPLSQSDFELAIRTGKFESLSVKSKRGENFHPPVNWWSAIGVLCGTPSDGLLFVDHDGESCDSLIERLSNQSVAEALPKTVAVTSRRAGRYQLIYRIPEQFWGAISTKKLLTGTQGEDGKPEQLEFRWDGSQSVIAGYHPTTGSYCWLPGQSPQESEVAEVPDWIIEQMLQDIPSQQPAQVKSRHHSYLRTWTERDWAISYLTAIPASEDYDTWLRVGMGLHSVGEDLLADWEDWSRSAANYEPDACATRWKSFKSTRGLSLGTLGLLAKQNGWQSPFKEDRGDRPALTVIQGSSSQPLEDLDEDSEELAQEVQSLVKLTEETAPVQTLLSPRLTALLMHRAKQFNVPLETFIGILLPLAASLLRLDTQLEISAASAYRCSPILWSGLVGESGTNKSPIFDTLLEPMQELQAQEDEIYTLQNEQYEDELEDWQKSSKEERGNKPTPPAQREYYLLDTTLEAIADCLSRQPGRGVVIPVDEFAGFFNGFNQYRAGGKGSDRQKFLSAYNGGALKVNRKVGKRIFIAKTSISLAGTIQPCVLRKLMSDLDEVDGFWARFLWIPLPLTEMPPPDDEAGCNLFGVLQSLYQGLENLAPETYQFDQRGRSIWRDWHILCEQHKVNEPNPALRAVYPKSKERAARVALVAHCINAVVEGRVPDQIVSSDLLKAAIAFTEWSIGQTRLIYADAGAILYEVTPKVVRFIERFRDSGWIKARDVTRWSSGKQKLNAEESRVFMKRVVALGYAIDNGKTSRNYAIRIKGDDGDSGNNLLQSPAPQDFDPSNNDGNSPVTPGNSNLTTPQSRVSELGKNISLRGSSPIVTTGCVSTEASNSKDLDENSIDLLPDVTRVVTTPKGTPGIESKGICYQVTGCTFQVGDRVVLTGEGNSRPASELKAIWTVKTIHSQKAIVECETLGSRALPLAWFTRYERSAEKGL